jgi:ribonuclease T1
MLKKYGVIILIAAFALVFWLGKQSANPTYSAASSGADAPIANPESSAQPSALPPNARHSLPSFLPPEAKQTLDLIARGGPFPHRQDGSTFQNREKRLPQKERGYYHEYTVATPGLHHRGAKRIVTGGKPIEIYYYTEDHYTSFREFEVAP